MPTVSQSVGPGRAWPRDCRRRAVYRLVFLSAVVAARAPVVDRHNLRHGGSTGVPRNRYRRVYRAIAARPFLHSRFSIFKTFFFTNENVFFYFEPITEKRRSILLLIIVLVFVFVLLINDEMIALLSNNNLMTLSVLVILSRPSCTYHTSYTPILLHI